MKKCFLLMGLIIALPLVACNKGPTRVEYEEFYNKTQGIEDYHHTHATVVVTFFSDLTQGGESSKTDLKMTLNYTWNNEQNRFIADEENEIDFGSEISRNLKDRYKNMPEEKEDIKSLGFKYYINPFKVYVDITETIESRTIRTIESSTYDKYGYITSYLLQATASGTYQDQPISGTQKTAYSVTYE